MKERIETEKIFKQLCQVIPGGVNSPIRAGNSIGQLPIVADYGTQDTIVDVDGNVYFDFCGSWGALIHGHAHPQILQAVQMRMAKGTTFGVTTEIEEKLARKIVDMVDSVDKVRFVSSGTEATMSAARLARGYTKRDLIVKFSGNYHGHADMFLVEAGSGVFGNTPTSSSLGIPIDLVKQTISLPYNDIEACRTLFEHPDYRSQIAAVIIEPIAGNIGVVPATQEFIDFLCKETKKMGALMIFDEVISGFRVGLQGAQGIYNVLPDLTCFGKIIGGGFPAAAFGGRKEIMDCLAPIGKVYQAGTLSGNPVSMEAGFQALEMVQVKGFYEELQRKTDLFLQPLKESINSRGLNVCIQQVGSMFTLFFGKRSVRNMQDAMELDKEAYARFFKYLFSRGVYIPPAQQEAWFISNAHHDKNLLKVQKIISQYFEEEM